VSDLEVFFTVPRKTFYPLLNDFVSLPSSTIQSLVLFDIILMSSYAECPWDGSFVA